MTQEELQLKDIELRKCIEEASKPYNKNTLTNLLYLAVGFVYCYPFINSNVLPNYLKFSKENMIIRKIFDKHITAFKKECAKMSKLLEEEKDLPEAYWKI